ncbi:MAG: ATP-binding cassette domain-containing protein [bacterium]
MISAKNLTKKYGDTVVLDNLNFEINKGEVLGFLGPNGAGKTTTMRIMTGFISPSNGTIKIGELDVCEDSLEIRKKIGYLPESNPLYYDMKVVEYIRFIAKVRGQNKERIKKMINICGLEKAANKPIGELSKGYRQRVGLAQAMIHDPDILILDEPTSGLDPNQIIEIRKLIKEIGKEKTVILSTHILPEVTATCDKVIIINEGKIVAQGTTNELMSKAKGKTKIYFKVKGPQEEVIEKYKNIDAVEKIERVDKEGDDIFGYTVEVAGSEDLRGTIFRTSDANGWTLLELTPQKANLEDVFHQLTR